MTIINEFVDPSRKLNSSRSYLMLLLVISFFFYQFIPRIWMGLIMEDLMKDMQINATQYGIMASFYYYGYAIMQIPTAMLVHKYGTRSIVSLFAVICGIMMMVFSTTNNFYIGCFARFMIGSASAAGIMGISQVISDWFTKDLYGKALGVSISLGLIGALYGGKPISILLEQYSYKEISNFIGIAGIFLGGVILMFLQSGKKYDVSNEASASKPLTFISTIKLVLSYEILLLGMANFFMVGILEGFADVWGVEYLVNKFAISKSDAAFLTSLIFLGLMIGSPLLNWIEPWFNTYILLTIVGITMTGLMSCLLWFNLGGNSFLMFILLGIASAYQTVVLNLGARILNHKHTGIVLALLNSLNMLGGSFFHTGIGSMISSAKGSLNFTEESAYVFGLSLIPITSLMGVLIFIFLYLKSRRKI